MAHAAASQNATSAANAPPTRGAHGLVASAWPLAVVFAAALATVVTWYRSRGLIWGNDTSFPLDLRVAANYFNIPDAALGAPDVRKLPFIVPVMAVLWAWRALGLPYDVTTAQPLLIVALLATSGVSVYTLVRLLFSRVARAAALGGALFYMFNLYSLTWIWQSLSNLIFHYSLLPLVLLAWLIALRRRSIPLAVASSIVWVLALTPAYVTTPIALTDSLLFAGVVATELLGAADRRDCGRVLECGIVAYAIWLAFSLFWIVPLLLYSDVVTTRGLESGTSADLFQLNSVPFGKAIRLAGYWGVTGRYLGSSYYSWRSYYLEIGVTAALVVPLIAGVAFATGFLGIGSKLLGALERRYVTFLATVLLVAALAMTGPNPPLGDQKEWLFRETGLIGPFRSAYQRFGEYAALAYAPLVALGLSIVGAAIRQRVAGRLGSVLATCAMLVLTVAVAVVPALPLWTGSSFDPSGIVPARRVSIPSAYESMAALMNRRQGDFTVLTFPFGKAGSVTALRWNLGESGYVGVEPLNLLTPKAQITGDARAPWVTDLVRRVAAGGSRAIRALELLDVRYVVVHRDTNRPYVAGIDAWVGPNTAAVAGALDATSGLTRLRADPELFVYRVDGWRPFRLFAVRGYDGRSIYRLRASHIRPIAYRRRSDFRFSIPAGQLRRGDVLVVNQPFDSRWQASGRSPIVIEPGLTGFRVDRGKAIEVEHRLEQRFPVLLGTLALAAFIAGGVGLASVRRARRS